jgi:hypothetical protein
MQAVNTAGPLLLHLKRETWCSPATGLATMMLMLAFPGIVLAQKTDSPILENSRPSTGKCCKLRKRDKVVV